MMVEGGWELMLLGMLACGVGFPLLVLVAGWLTVRSWRSAREGRTMDRPRELLNRRLAAGEIGVEEYYERESALRSGEPLRHDGVGRRRRRS